MWAKSEGICMKVVPHRSSHRSIFCLMNPLLSSFAWWILRRRRIFLCFTSRLIKGSYCLTFQKPFLLRKSTWLKIGISFRIMVCLLSFLLCFVVLLHKYYALPKAWLVYGRTQQIQTAEYLIQLVQPLFCDRRFARLRTGSAETNKRSWQIGECWVGSLFSRLDESLCCSISFSERSYVEKVKWKAEKEAAGSVLWVFI